VPLQKNRADKQGVLVSAINQKRSIVIVCYQSKVDGGHGDGK
jgi:hypothetical protein